MDTIDVLLASSGVQIQKLWFSRSVFGSGEPEGDSVYKPSDYELFLVRTLNWPCMEIWESQQALKDIPLYLSIFPYKNLGVDRTRYLKYHIENYLVERSVLRNRLLYYLTVLSRAYRKHEAGGQISNSLRQLEQKVQGTFDPLTTVRNSHVHNQRYSDTDLNQLSELDLFTKVGTGPLGELSSILRQQKYTETRLKWKSQMKANDEELGEFTEYYFEKIYASLTENDLLLIPPGLGGRSRFVEGQDDHQVQ